MPDFHMSLNFDANSLMPRWCTYNGGPHTVKLSGSNTDGSFTMAVLT